MAYRVIITKPAKHQLDMYIAYTINEFQNMQAARSIRDDAKNTKNRLSENADLFNVCENPILAKYGYRRILFGKHDFFMVYRIDGNKAIVEAMYHEKQDYEAVFISKMGL